LRQGFIRPNRREKRNEDTRKDHPADVSISASAHSVQRHLKAHPDFTPDIRSLNRPMIGINVVGNTFAETASNPFAEVASMGSTRLESTAF
jgi:hypothetical protein